MEWKKLLGDSTGSVDEGLLLRKAYRVADNRILRHQIAGRVPLTDAERKTLAEIGKALGKQAREEVAPVVTPDTIRAWHRKLVAQKFDGSQQRRAPGRPKIAQELEASVVRMAQEKRSWGYDRMAGALAHLGDTISDQTVGDILKRHGVPPAPKRKKTTPGKECGRTPMAVLVATDCFTTEGWTWRGLVTYDVLCFIHRGTREVHVAGIPPPPDQRWRVQIARNITLAEWEFLSWGPYLIHERDGKDCPPFPQTAPPLGARGCRCRLGPRISTPMRHGG
jgi:putative transposase